MKPGPSAGDIIRELNLTPLTGEGGYFRQTVSVPNPDDDGAPITTAILFLVTPESWSGLHMLESDELFHFHLGDECRMVVCSRDGGLEERRLGSNVLEGSVVQTLVPGGTWQGTMLAGDGEFGFALLGTTMTPGFRIDQFVLAGERDIQEFEESIAARLRPFLAPDAGLESGS